MININSLVNSIIKPLLIENLDEAKQLGTIYHFTGFKGIDGILSSDAFKGSEISVLPLNNVYDRDFQSFGKSGQTYSKKGIDKVYYLSTTRDKLLYIKNPKIKDSTVRIVLDGDKLSNKYKFDPFYYYSDEMIDEPAPKHDQDESEERIILGTKTQIGPEYKDSAKKYIKEVHILLDKIYDNENYLKVIAELVKKYPEIKCYYKEKPIELKDYINNIVPTIEPYRDEDIFESIVNNIKNDNTSDKEQIEKIIQPVEDFADKELNPLDIEFSNHFFKRLVDPRNIKPISSAELIGFFKRLAKKKKQLFDFLSKYKEIVATDNRTDINIPLVKQSNTAIAKTIMRNKYFKTSSPRIEFSESLNESINDSFDDALNSLIKYMVDQGMNIQPLPSLKIIDNDVENANNILGKTAHYDPNDCSITLYTLNRHPKDILRSFSHEMIHRIQDNEGRLNNINTTNTNEDGDLPELEREAYLKGNICFRKWEDSIKN
jgi:hypothetical protein